MRKLNVITRSNTALKTTILAALLFIAYGSNFAELKAYSNTGEFPSLEESKASVSFEFDLALEKTLLGNTTPRIGDNVQFEILIRNEADHYAANYTITDDISDGFEFLPSLNPGWEYADGRISYFEKNYLGGGDERSYIVTLKLLHGNQYKYRNVAEITQVEDNFGDGDSDIDSTPDDDLYNDPHFEDDNDDATVNIFDLALINKVVTANNAIQYKAEEQVCFEMTVRNQGNIEAHDIEVINYATDGLDFDPEVNPDWKFIGSGYINDKLPVLAPGQSSTVQICYTVEPTMTHGLITNYAEITAGSNPDIPGAVDYDSTPDSDKDNDAGGVAGTSTDNNFEGNGTDDEDDHDPAAITINFVDIALKKTINDAVVESGGLATFDITVINQGTEVIKAVKVIDYLPEYTTLEDPNWHIHADDPTGRTVYNIFKMDGGLEPGKEMTKTITIRLDTDVVTSVLINYAEVVEITNIFNQNVTNFDIDSHADDTNGNDVGGIAGTITDDEVNNDGTTDEDDHDPAMIYFLQATSTDCVCQNNATLVDRGLFERTVIVTAPSGQVWRVDVANNVYDPSSDPDNLVPIETGILSTPLIEMPNIDGITSEYHLSIEHIDGEQIYIRFVNDLLDYDEYSAVACNYEKPQIISDLPFALCEGATAMYSVVDEPGCNYTWYLDDLMSQVGMGPEFSMNWPTTGNYTLILVKECTDRCIAPVTKNVQVGNTGGQISCINDINLSLGEDCELEVTPGMVLAGNPLPGASYEIILMEADGTVIPNATLNETHLWKPITVKLLDGCTGNTCWSTMVVEDKMAPVIDCSDVEVFCHELDSYQPIVTENCGGYTVEMIGETIDLIECDEDFIKTVVRTYKAVDDYGNESEPCSQTIMVRRIPLDDILPPPHFRKSDMPSTALQCNMLTLNEYGNPDISQTGVPSLDGIDLYPDSGDIYCRIGVGYSDYEVETFDCGRKIMRTWQIYEDSCPDGSIMPPQGSRLWEFVQTIEIEDKIDPEIEAPKDITVYSNLPTCEASVTLPPAVASDECSEPVEIDVAWGFGDFLDNQNGGVVVLPFGGPYNITYTAYDACGNTASDIMTVEVHDGQKPVARCDEQIVSLRSDGTAEMYAIMFDEGSYDNCNLAYMEVRRLDDNPCDPADAEFGPYISFCCDDIGPDGIPVELAVYDEEGNMSLCETKAIVQFKNGPIINAPEDLEISCTEDFSIEGILAMGAPDIFDPCGDSTYTYMVLDSLVECGEGSFQIKYTTESNGNMVMDIQTIHIVNDDHFDLNTINFPPDIDFTNNLCLDLELHPDNLDPPFNYPSFTNTSCDLVSATEFTDKKFYLEDDVNTCFKIIRTWKAINYCTDEELLRDQVIKVINTEKPIIDCSGNTTEFSSTDNCYEGEVYLLASAEDQCTPDDELMWEYQLDVNDDGIFIPGLDISASGLGAMVAFNELVPIGSHSISFSFTDQCSNTESCVLEFDVLNNVGPEIACAGNVSIGLSPWDTDGDLIADTEKACIGLDSLIVSYSHMCDEDITFSFDSIDIITELCFDCLDIGTNTVTIYGIDETGDIAQCDVIVDVQDNNDHQICSDFDLALIKEIDEATSTLPAQVGEDVTFVITVFNQGSTLVDSVEIVDYIPDGLTFNQADNPDWTLDGSMATISLGPDDIPGGGLAEAEEFFVLLVLEVNANANADNLTNVAEIKSASDTDGNFGDDDNDSTPDMINDDVIGGDNVTDGTDGDEDDHDPETVPLFDLALIKSTADLDAVELGDNITFDITVCNQGNANTDFVEITDYIPAGLDLADANWTDNGATASITINSGDLVNGLATIPAEGLAPGACFDVAISFTVNSSATVDNLINYAEISDGADVDGNDVDIDSDPGSNSGDENDVDPGDPEDDSFDDPAEDDHDPAGLNIYDLSLTKSLASTAPFEVGDIVAFEIFVTNEGNVDATNVTITDYIQCGFAFGPVNPGWVQMGDDDPTYTFATIAAGETESVFILLEILPEDSTCGEYKNIAEITTDSDNDFDSTPGNMDMMEDDLDMDILTLCPTEILTDPFDICSDSDPVTLTGTPNTGTWSGTGVTDNNDGTASFDPDGLSPGDYVATYTDDCEQSITITVFAPLDVSLSPGASICNSDDMGDVTTLDLDDFVTNNSGLPGVWTDEDDMVVSPDIDFTGHTPGVEIYTYTVDGPEPCGDFVGTVEITVLDCVCTLEIEIDGVTSYCGGNLDLTAVIDVAGTPPYSYSWVFDGDEVGTNATLNIAAVAGTYTLTVEDDNGCTDTTNIDVTVETPLDVTLEPTAEVCNSNDMGEVTTLDLDDFVTNNSGVAGVWTDSDDMVIDPMIDFNGVTMGFYTFTYTVLGTDPCPDFVGNIVVNVQDCACTLVVEIDGPSTYCAGDNLDLTAVIDVDGTPPYTYEWMFDSNVVGTASTLDIEAEDGTYMLMVVDDEDCTALASIDITVNALPTVDAGVDITACEGDDVVLTGTTNATSADWTWTGPSTNVSGTFPADPITATVTDAGTYVLDITDNDTGCMNSDTVEVMIASLNCPDFVDNNGDELCFEVTADPMTGNGDLTDLFETLAMTYNDAVCGGIASISTTDGSTSVPCESDCTSLDITITTNDDLEIDCSILVSVVDETPPTIECPDDVTIDCMDLDIPTLSDPDNVTINDNCSEGLVAVPDVEVESDGCDIISVTITWTVEDEAGLMATCTQVVTIDPNSACPSDDPVVLDCPDAGIFVEDPDCDGEVVDVADLFTFTNNAACCGDVTFSYGIPGASDVTGSVATFDEPGIYDVTVTAEDDCGMDMCMFQIVLVDTIEIRCNKIITFIGDDGTVTFAPEDFSTTMSGCNGQVMIDVINQSFDPDVPVTTMTWDCMDPIEQNIYFNIYFETILGPDSCDAILFINDPNNICGTTNNEFMVAGTISNEYEERISNVSVELQGANVPAEVTGGNGFYAFPDMPFGGQYTIAPVRDDSHLNGVSTRDLIKIQRHVLGMEVLDSPYKIIAADVNASNDVTVIDIVELRKLILGIYDKLPQSTSWKMIESTHSFADPLDPFNSSLPAKYDINSLEENMFIDFIGVKVGDVTGNAKNNVTTDIDIEARSNDQYELLAQVQQSQDEDIMFIGSESDEEIFGFQMTLDYNDQDVQIKSVVPHETLTAYFGYHIQDGHVTVSLSSPEVIDINEIAYYFTITYESQNGSNTDIFEISSTIAQAEAYSANDVISVVLRDAVENNLETFEVAQNNPNPWSDQTSIIFNTMESGIVDFSIISSNGKVMRYESQFREAGIHTIELSSDEFNGPGIYHYTISSAGNSVTKRFLLIK